jgi:DNA polymerase-3 subunit chi
MTRIDFHANVADPCAHACRLLRKASAQGARLWVLAEPALLEQLDHDLWALGPSEFVAHCRSDASAELLAASPIILHALQAQDASALPPAGPDSVLVNLSRSLPQGYAGFERLIEILPRPEHDAEAVALARQRWSLYKSQGHVLSSHDLS